MKILYDIIDVCLLRVRPLEQYVYPRWQLMLVLAGVSLAAAPGLAWLHADTLSRTAFVFALKLLQYLAMARFLAAWLRLPVGRESRPMSPWNGQGDLLTIIVLVQGLDFLAPLTLWVGRPLQGLVALALFVYGFVLLVQALARSTGASARVVVAGLFICAPIMLLIQFVFASMALSWGWINPQELMQMMGAASSTQASGAASPAF